MRAGRWAVIGMLLSIAMGCAHATGTHLASNTGSMCKHCNCLMPADVEEGAQCPVCECHNIAAQCHRGRHE